MVEDTDIVDDIAESSDEDEDDFEWYAYNTDMAHPRIDGERHQIGCPAEQACGIDPDEIREITRRYDDYIADLRHESPHVDPDNTLVAEQLAREAWTHAIEDLKDNMVAAGSHEMVRKAKKVARQFDWT